MAYNVQTMVDAENNIPIDYKVTNQNDSKAMGDMLRRAKSILHTNRYTALFDKGYHTGSQLAIADELKINTLIAIPTLPGASHAPSPQNDVIHFSYNKQKDTYACPQGKVLTTNGTWHKAKSSNGKVAYHFKNYTTWHCKSCPVQPLCTKSHKNGKQVRRSEYTENIENNRKRVQASKKLYKRR